MDQPHEGQLDAGSPGSRAIALAGAIAEAGIVRLAVEYGNAWIELQARTTDLPTLLLTPSHSPLTLQARADTTLSIFNDRIEWKTCDPALADALRRASAALQRPPAP